MSVIGGSSIDQQHYDRAREVGRLLSKRGHEVVCGGLGGVMEATCRGAIETGGHTIGILPGEDRDAANEYVETVVATGMGNARNALVVLNGDAAVAIDGSTGTLSEIALALDRGLPVAGLDTHDVDGVEAVETPEKAVEYVEREVGEQ
ncbi:putative Rossmann fold nucleotide-binding protein [Halapricum desulfuricans]|uniref:Putative Rossmann fold nucleotide-binding protein n=1 Tax=Halapricum desulfuricans TaxID=2841257 RepID=A0A897N371_9EURY|nr:putative Rossmann fold nucleotide-binding protein [Halapricum desulfuricans]